MKLPKNQPHNGGVTAHRNVSVTHTQVYQGQLPPPDMLQQFNSVDPTFANRIVTMAETEQKSRHDNERTVTRHVGTMSLMGIVFAFLSVLIMSGLVFYALWLGYAQTASAIAVGAIAAVASVFIFFRRRIKTEQKE